MSHLCVWRSKRTNDVYFSGKIPAAEAEAWLRSKFQTGTPEQQVFHIIATREEAQEDDGPDSRDRPQY